MSIAIKPLGEDGPAEPGGLTMRPALAFAAALALLAGVASAPAQAVKLTPELRDAFRAAVASHGYNCRGVSTVTGPRDIHRGKAFKVRCNNDRLAYRVIVTPAGDFIVEPW